MVHILAIFRRRARGRAAFVAALLGACSAGAFAGAARAADLDKVVVFGDSISDSGAYVAKAQGGPGRFTTNPDPVWVEVVALGLGLDLKSSAAGGANYAEGGARVAAERAQAPGDLTRKPIVRQIDAFEAAGGRLDDESLVIIQGGGNDVFSTQLNGPGFTAADLAVLDSAATTLADQLGRLQDLGAGVVVTTSVPRFEVFNVRYEAAIAARNVNVLYIDLAALITQMEAEPARFGLSNITDRACRGSALESFICMPDDLATPDANRTYLFADGVHFTGAVHRMEGQMTLAALTAPAQIGRLAGAVRADVAVARDLVEAANREGMEFGWSFVGAMSAATTTLDRAGSPSMGVRSDTAGLAAGARHLNVTGLAFGAMVSLTQSDGDFSDGGGDFQGRNVMAWAFASAPVRGWVVSTEAGLGGLDLDEVTRRFAIGPDLRAEHGDTDGRTLSAALRIVPAASQRILQLRPVAQLRYEGVRIDGYGEAGVSNTRADFTSQSMEVLFAGLGGRLDWAPRPGWSLSARALWEADLLDESRDMMITFAGAPSGWRAPLWRPGGELLSASLSARAELGQGWNAQASIRGETDQEDYASGVVSASLLARF